MICEQYYYYYVGWTNDQNKLCRSWEVIQLCSWKVFHLNSFRASKIHSKNWFAEGQKMHTAKCLFAECQNIGTRQNTALSSDRKKALGKLRVNCLFEALNEFKSKSGQLQSFITFWDLQFSFSKFFHPRSFEKFEF